MEVLELRKGKSYGNHSIDTSELPDTATVFIRVISYLWSAGKLYNKLRELEYLI